MLFRSFPLRALREAGYSVADAKVAGYPVWTGWLTPFKDAGYTAAECIAGGFSEHDLFQSGFPLAEWTAAEATRNNAGR